MAWTHGVEQSRRAPSEAADAGPTTFGKYTLIARLGSGGMAEAHLAMLHGSMGFQKLVVLKRMHASLGRDQHFVQMFVDEARLAARLNHPNVVSTTEVGEVDGDYFIAMEYLEGLSLDRVVRKYLGDGGSMPIGLLLRVACDALEGLHHAHELRDFDGRPLQVVHRDVTPSNIFVTADGMGKVLDFGIAKAALQDEATRTGMLKGKLAYMAPEQFYPSPIDRRADLWSMGVLLWEMITGRRLFKAANDAVTYKNIAGMAVPPLREFRADAPEGLDAALGRALERDREHRYADAESMRRALDVFVREGACATSRADVAAEMRQSFGDVLEENRRVIREYARPGAVHEGLPLGLSASGTLRRGAGATLPPTPDVLDARTLGIAPIAPATPRQAAPQPPPEDDDEDDDQFDTMVNERVVGQRTVRDAVMAIEPLRTGTVPAQPMPPRPIGAAVRPASGPGGDRSTRLDGTPDVGAFDPFDPHEYGATTQRPVNAQPESQAETDTVIESRAGLMQGAGLVAIPSVSLPAAGQGEPEARPPIAATMALPSVQLPEFVPGAMAPGGVAAPQGAAGIYGQTTEAFPAAEGPAPGRLRARLVAALGWVILLAVLGGLGALGWSEREGLMAGLRALIDDAPPDPLSTGTFRLRVLSTPSGAHVYEGDQDLGFTPLELPMMRREVRAQPRRFVVRHPGFRDVVIEQGTSPHSVVVLQVNLIR